MERVVTYLRGQLTICCLNKENCIVIIFLIILATCINPAGGFDLWASVNGQKILNWKTGMAKTNDATSLKSSYFTLGYVRNFPAANSIRNFAPGNPHPVLGFKYFLATNWSVGLSARFKFLNFEGGDGGELAIASLSQESLYLYRLSHPLYLELGGSVLFLNPTKRGMVPLHRNDNYPIELGVSGEVGLIYFFERHTFIQVAFDRWRGTKSMKLHGYEFMISMGYQI